MKKFFVFLFLLNFSAICGYELSSSEFSINPFRVKLDSKKPGIETERNIIFFSDSSNAHYNYITNILNVIIIDSRLVVNFNSLLNNAKINGKMLILDINKLTNSADKKFHIDLNGQYKFDEIWKMSEENIPLLLVKSEPASYFKRYFSWVINSTTPEKKFTICGKKYSYNESYSVWHDAIVEILTLPNDAMVSVTDYFSHPHICKNTPAHMVFSYDKSLVGKAEIEPKKPENTIYYAQDFKPIIKTSRNCGFKSRKLMGYTLKDMRFELSELREDWKEAFNKIINLHPNTAVTVAIHIHNKNVAAKEVFLYLE